MTAPKASRRPRLVALMSFVCWCGCLGAILASVLGISAFAAPDFWLADNMSFFLRQFLAGGLAGCMAGAIGLLLRHRFALLYRTTWFFSVLALLTLVILTGSGIRTNTIAVTDLQEGAQPIKVISVNIEFLFMGDRKFQQFIKAENADIVVVQEALWEMQERLWERMEQVAHGNGGNGLPQYFTAGKLGGLVVYSRFPILDMASRVVEGERPPGASVFYDANRELLSLVLDTDRGPLNLLVIHPDSPRTESRWLNKRRYFDAIDAALGDIEAAGRNRVLAIGDWNSSPWSTRFQRTLADNGLKTAYPDGWPQTTRFFFDYRLHWILGAPVDQFGVSGDLQVLDVSLGPDIGSDHLPLIVELGLPAAASE